MAKRRAKPKIIPLTLQTQINKFSASRRIRLSEIDPIECECDSCVTNCSNKPGWFAPGEAERAAEPLGISLRELFETRLMVDWPTPNPNNQFLLSPAIVGGEPGAEFPVNPRGVCVFLTEGKCGIHGAKPRECRESDHRNTQEETTELHEEIGKQWATPEHQAQIRTLLGREPVEAEEWSDELTPIGKLYAAYARLMGE